MAKYVPPSTDETAFNCPRCGALAKQFWHSVHADRMEKDRMPTVIRSVDEELKRIPEKEIQEGLRSYIERLASGAPFLGENHQYRYYDAYNVFFSRCYNCDEISIWIYDKLIYPQRGEAPEANPDLSPDIRRDYDEASSILDLSPRGAAALIRLSIQKLCKELGESGKNINDDIKSLVAKGLDARIQKALDAVRVIGNEAVHPGTIDLRDDKATAESLSRLLNLIAEKMISEPKHVGEVYAMLPSEKLAAIEKRDKKAGA